MFMTSRKLRLVQWFLSITRLTLKLCHAGAYLHTCWKSLFLNQFVVILETSTLTVILTHDILFHQQFLRHYQTIQYQLFISPVSSFKQQSKTKLFRQLIELFDMFPLSKQRDPSSCKNNIAFTPVRIPEVLTCWLSLLLVLSLAPASKKSSFLVYHGQ